MSGSPKHAVVTVILKSDNPLDFDIESDDLPKDSDGNLVFHNDHHPGFKVEFELDDKLELGYLFPPNSNKQDAVWSKLGKGACPKSAAHEVFKVQSVRPHRRSVIVLNPNSSDSNTLGDFGYTLRVTKTDGAPYLDLDPGGVNQNGPTRPLSRAALLIAGGVVGAVVALGAEALLFN